MVGAFGPALRAGSPVTGSITIRIRCGRFLRGVSTIRPSSIFASRGSPGRISSRRRSGPGNTTCPLIDTLVCMVRQSYVHRGCCAVKSRLPLQNPPRYAHPADSFFGDRCLPIRSADRRQPSNLIDPFSSLHHQCTAWILLGWSSRHAPPIPLGFRWSGTTSL